MKNSLNLILAAAGCFLAAAAAFAQSGSDDHASHHPAVAASASAPSAEGEVRKIDKAAAKVTLRHGPIANLEMPGMTMVFRVADASLLDQLTVGDKVRFSAERLNGVITLTGVEVVK